MVGFNGLAAHLNGLKGRYAVAPWQAALAASIAGIFAGSTPAVAAPVRAEALGEVDELTLNNPDDPWSGGTLAIKGERIILPRNLLVDYPANRLSLHDTFAQAPAECVALHETGLARRDVCRHGEPGAIATIFANRTNAGNLIAGEVHFAKGTEVISGNVSFVDFINGFLRMNGTPGSATEGIMVRLDDPQGRHTVQQGPGCLSASPNCSADVRFAVDSENYTVTSNNGYPLCLPSTLATALRTHPAAADGTGDSFCPATNRAGLAATVADSTRFAPIQVGDSVTIQGNRELIAGVEFVSAWALLINTTLLTRNDPTQPDYLRTETAKWDPPGFNANRVRATVTALSTLPGPEIDTFAVHHQPANNAPFETLLGSTVGNPATGVVIAGPQIFFKFQYDVRLDALKTNAKFDPCANLANAGTPCPGGITVASAFSVLSPTPRELGIRSRHKATLNPGVVSFDASGNQTVNGVYLTPIGFDYAPPGFIEINPALANIPFDFEGIPWMADRRTSPGGCLATCETTPQPLDPFPFSGLDPRNEVPVPVPDRVLATAPFAGGHVPFPQIDPPFIPVAPVVPPPLACVAQVFPPPTLISVTPNTGMRGTGMMVTLTGTGFRSGMTCSFGAEILASCTVNSLSSASGILDIDALAALGPRNVVVTNTDLQTATLTAGFTVVPFPAPTLTSATPNSAFQGAGLTVALVGTNLRMGATCSFGPGISAACNVLSATLASAVIDLDPLAVPGARDVTLVNPDGQTATLTAGFAVVAPVPPPPPVLTSIAPTHVIQGTSRVVTLTGTGFILGATCTFGAGITGNCGVGAGGTSAQATVAVDIAAALGTRDVTLTNPGGQSSILLAALTVDPAPTAQNPPTAVLTVTVNPVVIGGSTVLNFATTNASTVTLAPLGTMATASGAVTVTPAATTTYTLTATGPGGTATSSVTVNVVPAPPTATLVATPSTLVAGASTVLTFTSTGGTTAQLTPTAGVVALNGTFTATPANTTTYVFVVSGPGGVVTATAVVKVNPAPPPTPLFDQLLTGTGTNVASWRRMLGRFNLGPTSATGATANNESLVIGLSVADVRVDTIVVAPTVAGSVGFRMRVNPTLPESASYGLKLSNTGLLSLLRKNAAVDVALSTAQTAVDLTVPHTLTAVVTGAGPVLITASVDGVPLLTFTDASASALTTAGGIMASSTLGGQLKRMTVSPPF